MKIIYVLAATLCCTLSSFAQNVGIGTPTPNTSAKLEVSSTNSGVLIPRMSKAQRNAITSPALGLLVFQNAPDSVGFYYYNAGNWVWLQNASGAGSGWSTTGNTGTDTSVNFIGTKDNMPLRFKVNNISAGFLDGLATVYGYRAMASSQLNFDPMNPPPTGIYNTAIGTQALELNYSGNYNTAIGQEAISKNLSGNSNIGIGAYSLLSSQTQSDNIAIGTGALESIGYGINNPNIGTKNIGIGTNSLAFNKRGNGAVAIGFNAAYSDTAAEGVVAIGRAALFNNNGKHGNLAIGDSALFNTGFGGSEADGFDNVGIGSKVLFKNVQGYYNTALGSLALYNNISIGNTAIGTGSLLSNTLGTMNIGVGPFSLQHNNTGEGNTAIGINGLYNNTTGNYNTALGHLAMQGNSGPNATSNSNTAIGSFAMSSNSTGNNNTSAGDSSLYKNTTGYSNVAIGSKAMFKNTKINNLVAIGDSALFNAGVAGGEFGKYSTAVGSKALFSLDGADGNTAVGYNALMQTTGASNTAVGSFAGKIVNGSYNTIIGSYNALTAGVRNINSSVFIGFEAGESETTSNKLYIENSGATKDNALIYGDFAADSLNLNAKVNIRDYTRLGTQASGAPAIKMKELTGATALTQSGSQPISLVGIDPAKIIAVNTLVGVASNAVWLPPSYDNDPRLKYNYYVHTNGNLYIQNQSTDCTSPGDHICNKTVKIVITYKE